MLIYQGTTDEFVRLNRMNRIADVMDETFFSFTGRHAGQSEYNSWQNSLTRVRDLLEVAELKADINATRDPVLQRNSEHFEEYVKNIYRVLMSRGMKGCFVYFADKEVESYFQERINN